PLNREEAAKLLRQTGRRKYNAVTHAFLTHQSRRKRRVICDEPSSREALGPFSAIFIHPQQRSCTIAPVCTRAYKYGIPLGNFIRPGLPDGADALMIALCAGLPPDHALRSAIPVALRAQPPLT